MGNVCFLSCILETPQEYSHTHVHIFWDTFLFHRLYRPIAKPGRCTVDTGTITLCLLCTPVCVCALVLTDFCLFSQALPIRECSMASLQLSQLFHSPLLSLWKKSFIFTETNGNIDSHHKRKLTTTSTDVYACVLGLWCRLHFLDLNSKLFAGFQISLSCYVLSCPWSTVQRNRLPSIPLFIPPSPHLPGESALKLWQTAV